MEDTVAAGLWADVRGYPEVLPVTVNDITRR